MDARSRRPGRGPHRGPGLPPRDGRGTTECSRGDSSRSPWDRVRSGGGALGDVRGDSGPRRPRSACGRRSNSPCQKAAIPSMYSASTRSTSSASRSPRSVQALAETRGLTRSRVGRGWRSPANEAAAAAGSTSSACVEVQRTRQRRPAGGPTRSLRRARAAAGSAVMTASSRAWRSEVSGSVRRRSSARSRKWIASTFAWSCCAASAARSYQAMAWSDQPRAVVVGRRVCPLTGPGRGCGAAPAPARREGGFGGGARGSGRGRRPRGSCRG